YLFYPDSDRLDASLALAVRFGYPSKQRMRSTLQAIDHDLGAGAFHYRYTDAQEEEGCFLACTFWLIEASAILGQQEHAVAAYAD
ncbi:glycoside hydrolase family 15 protein, partial [Mycobacterium tuberculosis]|nr:glycoside hydrolase family 15 protein [Mycobacterium tuberculosis]